MLQMLQLANVANVANVEMNQINIYFTMSMIAMHIYIVPYLKNYVVHTVQLALPHTIPVLMLKTRYSRKC